MHNKHLLPQFSLETTHYKRCIIFCNWCKLYIAINAANEILATKRLCTLKLEIMKYAENH